MTTQSQYVFRMTFIAEANRNRELVSKTLLPLPDFPSHNRNILLASSLFGSESRPGFLEGQRIPLACLERYLLLPVGAVLDIRRTSHGDIPPSREAAQAGTSAQLLLVDLDTLLPHVVWQKGINLAPYSMTS